MCRVRPGSAVGRLTLHIRDAQSERDALYQSQGIDLQCRRTKSLHGSSQWMAPCKQWSIPKTIFVLSDAPC